MLIEGMYFVCAFKTRDLSRFPELERDEVGDERLQSRESREISSGVFPLLGTRLVRCLFGVSSG